MCVGVCVLVCVLVLVCVGVLVVCGLVGVLLCVFGLCGPPSVGPPFRQTALRWTALPLDRPKFRSFFPLPAPFSFFFSLSLGVTFGLSGCRVKLQRLWAREPQTRTFEGSGASNTTKIPREDTQRETKRARMGAGEEKKREILGPPQIGAPPFGAPPRAPPFGAHPSGPHPSGPHPSGHQTSGPHPSELHPSGPDFFWVWAPHFGDPMTHTRSRNGLAKNGFAKIGFGPNWPGHQDGQKWIGQNWIGQNWSTQDGQNGIGQSRSLPLPTGCCQMGKTIFQMSRVRSTTDAENSAGSSFAEMLPFHANLWH